MTMANIKKTHCPQGHPYDRTNAAGARFCSICYNAYQSAYQKAARAARKTRGPGRPKK
jgi:hypothetical protein